MGEARFQRGSKPGESTMARLYKLTRKDQDGTAHTTYLDLEKVIEVHVTRYTDGQVKFTARVVGVEQEFHGTGETAANELVTAWEAYCQKPAH
jgi:hypothetical protein